MGRLGEIVRACLVPSAQLKTASMNVQRRSSCVMTSEETKTQPGAATELWGLHNVGYSRSGAKEQDLINDVVILLLDNHNSRPFPLPTVDKY